MVKSNSVLALLASLLIVSLTSCSNTSYLPLGYGANPDTRKLNNEMRGKDVWINDPAKVEPPLTVRFAIDTFFSKRPGQPELGRPYKELQSITFRNGIEGGKRGAIAGCVVGGLGGFIINSIASEDFVVNDEAPSTFEALSPVIGLVAGAGIGFLVGYMIGIDYHYEVSRGASTSTSF